MIESATGKVYQIAKQKTPCGVFCGTYVVTKNVSLTSHSQIQYSILLKRMQACGAMERKTPSFEGIFHVFGLVSISRILYLHLRREIAIYLGP